MIRDEIGVENATFIELHSRNEGNHCQARVEQLRSGIQSLVLIIGWIDTIPIKVAEIFT